jgi:hypothetical protein
MPIGPQAKLLIFTSIVLACAAGTCLPGVAQACNPGQWAPAATNGSKGLLALVKNIPAATTWAGLPGATRERLQAYADGRLAEFRARWGRDALATKEAILLGCPTAEMTTAIDDYYRKTYDTVVSSAFALNDVTSAPLRRALTRNYLAAMSAARATITYPDGKLPNRDWDGKSLFDSFRLPDAQADAAIRQYSASVVRDLRAIDDATLGEKERLLKHEALFDSRSRATSFEAEVACDLISAHYSLIQGYRGDNGRPKIFADDDAAVGEANAMYLHSTELRFLDVGTWAASFHVLCKGTDDELPAHIGDPATNDVARAILLFQKWWVERVAAQPGAQNKCTVYSAADRAQIWDGFSAGQRSNNDGATSMETYRAQVEGYRDLVVARYRGVARTALRLVFPDDQVLTPEQRRRVGAAIDAETAFGLLPDKIAAALDDAQGTKGGPAVTAWKAAFAKNVATIGGNYAAGDPVRPEDEATVKAMFDEVKAWVARRYQNYPINIEELYGKFSFTVNTDGGASAANLTGNILFGVGTRRSRMEFYSLLLHELRHAVNFARHAAVPDQESDKGMVVEGAGVAVEALLLESFLKDTLKNELAYALYALDYGIRDARFVGTTEATLRKFLRDGCAGANEPNTVDFIKGIGAGYGLMGDLGNTLALRAHIGTQYFQYLSGGFQVLDDIAFLQSAVDPTGVVKIDPFVLFACGLNNPRRNSEYVASLKACVRR